MWEYQQLFGIRILYYLILQVIGYKLVEGFVSENGEVNISPENQHRAIIEENIKCLQHILYDPYPPGLYCNRTFDNITCWPDTPPGTVQIVTCPNYIHGFNTVGNATRRCMPDGQWYVSPSTNATWTNYSQCIQPRPLEVIPQLFTVHVEYIKIMVNTGYGISFFSLLLAVIIMLKFKKLHCPRNTVHVNMFMSFILRAIISFLKDLLLVQGLGFSFDVEKTLTDTVLFIENRMHWECKLLYTLFHYVISANYMWILVEGLHLHTLVYVSVFSERGSVKWYYLVGWGTPLLSILPWVVVRITLENILCWNTHPTPCYFWLLKGPIVLSLLVNFTFFINILRALFTKLHKPSTSSARRNRYRRLAKATLILIPLFGVHYLVFLGVPNNVNPTADVVKLYFEMFFNSFQGFLVAVLFCFLNQEVQMELRKTWHRWWSKPDPVYIQQSQHLADGNSHGSRQHRQGSRNELNYPKLSDGSTDKGGCLCKWTLDKNGRLTRTFVRTGAVKVKQTKKKLLNRETKM